jgi:hypothetical protein
VAKVEPIAYETLFVCLRVANFRSLSAQVKLEYGHTQMNMFGRYLGKITCAVNGKVTAGQLFSTVAVHEGCICGN